MEFGSTFERTASGELVTFARFYEDLCGDRPMPQRGDFRAADVPWIVGRLYMVDVMDGGADYRFRLFGTHLQAVFGADLSGRTLSDLELNGRLDSSRADFDGVVASGQPSYRTGLLVWPNRQTIGFERLMLPFAGRDGRVSQVLGALQGDNPVDELMLLKGFGLPHVLLDSPAGPPQRDKHGIRVLSR